MVSDVGFHAVRRCFICKGAHGTLMRDRILFFVLSCGIPTKRHICFALKIVQLPGSDPVLR